MKQAERTPGPWTIEGPDQFGDYNIHHPADRLAIGAIVSNMRPAEEVAANARFIVEAVNAYTSTEALRSALARCERAMKPFAAKVYNDNHDLTVSDTYRLTFEEYAAIYFAHKAARAALTASAAPSTEV